MSEQQQNILNQGVLIRLSIGLWEGKVKLPVSELNPDESVDKTLLTARKALIDGSHLDKLKKIRSEAYTYLYAHSYQSPIKGIAFAPHGTALKIIQKFKEISGDIADAADAFCANMDTYISEAEGRLGTLFDETEYPTGENLRRRFYFDYQVIELSEPSNPGIFDAETFAEEKAKFVQMQQQLRDEIITTAREQFLELVSTMAENMSQPGKRFKKTSIESFLDFLKNFEAMNVTNDADLAALIDKAKAFTDGHTGSSFANMVRDRSDLRREAGRVFRSIKDGATALIENTPARKMRTVPTQPDETADEIPQNSKQDGQGDANAAQMVAAPGEAGNAEIKAIGAPWGQTALF